jgi:hypothetical protein
MSEGTLASGCPESHKSPLRRRRTAHSVQPDPGLPPFPQEGVRTGGGVGGLADSHPQTMQAQETS